MATVSSRKQRELFDRLLRELEPTVRAGFLDAVEDLQSGVDLNRVIAAIKVGDVEGAVSALNINEAAFAKYSNALNNVYSQSATSMAGLLVSSGVLPNGARFNPFDESSVRWVAEHIRESVGGFTLDQREAARNFINSRYATQQGARSIALDLVGANTGRRRGRVGGILGLDAPRASRFEIVSNAIKTPEGVQSLVVKHLDGSLGVKYKVNEATAKRIIKAYSNGTAVSAEDRAISERQYKDALLKDRADTIVITETAGAVQAGMNEEWQQALRTLGASPENVIKTWRHARGATEFHRPEHLAMSGVSVRGLNAPFIFSDGVQKQFPHDAGGGARHNIRCACMCEYRIEENSNVNA